MTASPMHVVLSEWETAAPATHPVLRDVRLPANDTVTTLARQLSYSGVLGVTELREGLELRAFSHVGRLQLGDLTITIRPKIPAPSLLRLLRYAYDLRDLALFAAVDFDSETNAFQDLLLHQLAEEATELIARGLQRKYARQEEDLASPRGAINLRELARTGHTGRATLPCVHYPRLQDYLPNQVLLSGLLEGSRLALDPCLRVRLRRLAGMLREDVTPVRLNRDTFARLRAQSTWLVAAYQPAFTLIELLFAGQGMSLEPEAFPTRLPGFLFDMNRFFQALLARFLKENLFGYKVQEEARLRDVVTYNRDYNPRGRNSPAPRPDYIVLEDDKPVAILDAKYRDLWNKPLPREMLYQLAMYALVGGCESGAVILYPTPAACASEQRIDIRNPLNASRKAQVILRPVHLDPLEHCLVQKDSIQARRERTRLARHLAFGEHSSSYA